VPVGLRKDAKKWFPQSMPLSYYHTRPLARTLEQTMTSDQTEARQSLSTASEVAHAIRAGRLSASDVVEMQLDRVAKFNPALNAVVTLDADSARRRAREADRALSAGTLWGPLHGVPVTIKDSFDTAGLRTVSGYRPFAQRVPSQDAAPVARLREAGAIILGKTNLPTLADGIQTNNSVFGRTNNPWDLGRTPGGSSGVAAAAISAGLSFLELGSDIGGSIRIPAHFCGVHGLKATAGRIVGKGHTASPRPPKITAEFAALRQLAAFGPIARSVGDLRLALSIISDPGTPPLEATVGRTVSELRLAWTEDFGGTPLDADSRQTMQRLAEALKLRGCQIERCGSANVDYDEAWWISGICLGAINTLFQPLTRRWIRRLASPALLHFGPRHPLLRGLFTGLALDHQRVCQALKQRMAIIEQMERFLNTWDAWICPVFPTPAFTHQPPKSPIEVDDQPMSQLEANLLQCIIFNLTGHPVVTVPIGLSSGGLPIGIQVVGSRWHEIALLNVAQQIASIAGGYRIPSGY
jgi:amidase